MAHLPVTRDLIKDISDILAPRYTVKMHSVYFAERGGNFFHDL